jgi:hypothetical protein
MNMKKILHEPLFAFLLLGLSLFGVFEIINGGSEEDGKEKIVVTDGQTKSMILNFEKVRQRSPSSHELNGLIQGYVREEVLYRQALAMGLDQNDSIVRRRMSQKMDYLAQDLASMEEPADQDLQAFLDENRDSYRLPDRYTFQQVFFSASKRGEATHADAQAVLCQLKNHEIEIENLGDSLMVSNGFVQETENEIKRILGEHFFESLAKLSIGSWQGPIDSAFGMHLVRIDELIVGELPVLQEVRRQVLRDWSAQKQDQVSEELYRTLRQQYLVILPLDQDQDDNDKGDSLIETPTTDGTRDSKTAITDRPVQVHNEPI